MATKKTATTKTRSNSTVTKPVAKKTVLKKTLAAEVSVKKPRAKRTESINAPQDLDDLSTEAKQPFVLSKKTTYIILTVFGVGILLFLMSKYLVVAWVDQKPITRFEYYQALDSRYGKDQREEMIVQKLLESEASKKNVTVSSQELQDEIKKIEEQQGGAEKLDEILTAQNISRNEFSKLIRLQLVRTKLFSEGAEATDGAVMEYISQNKEVLPASKDDQGNDILPENDEKLKSSIKEQLKQQKINQSFSQWLQENLQGSRIVRS